MRSSWAMLVAAGVTGGLILIALPAEAHVLGKHSAGFDDGLFHPLTGSDHMIVALAVGALAMMRGGFAFLLLPAAFVAVIVAGGLVSLLGIAIPFTEFMVIASLLIVGCLIAANRHLALVPGIVITTVFGFFHGVAHGSEMPSGANAWHFVPGFAIGTALLLVLGGILIFIVRRIPTSKVDTAHFSLVR